VVKPDTKALLLQEGVGLVHRKGYTRTGIQELLKAAGVPKGSFYHHFRSKEDFGLQLIQFMEGFFLATASKHLGNQELPPLKRLRNLFDDYLAYFSGEGKRYGCPIGNLAQEMAGVNEAFREKLAGVLSKMKAPVRECLDLAQKNGELAPGFDTTELSDFIINSWEGALIAVKVADDVGPLRNFDHMIFDILVT